MKNRQFLSLLWLIIILFWIIIYQNHKIYDKQEMYNNDVKFYYNMIFERVKIIDEKVEKLQYIK